jgi:hypothetical protein
MHTLNIHALSGIRTHDPSVRESEDSSCRRHSITDNNQKYQSYDGLEVEHRVNP